jgi:lysophospholipase L1-like esterase
MLSILLLALAADPAPLTLAEGDRVLFLGDTLIEREQQSGYWEEALTRTHKDKSIVFRNLGWSGDTIRGESRAAFDPPAKGYQRLVELTKELKPTVIVIAYGANESFAGEPGRESFRKDYERLIADLTPTQAKFVLMTPPPFEDGPGMGDVARKNAQLASYVDTIRSIATAKNYPLINLYGFEKGTNRLTFNGRHFDANGYKLSAKLFGPGEVNEELRKAIVAKNELFFHRWRPQNETYLFGFRKHEQGKNAVEVASFDPLVAKAEEQIRAISRK